MKKKFVRETKNEVDTFLTRVNKVKQQPELFTNVCDMDSNIVDPSKITRANEMTGAGVEYLTSFVDFICTHFKNLVDHEKNALYYIAPEFEWPAAIDIMTGGLAGQRERVEISVMHYIAKPKQAIVLCADGHYRSAQPFVLQFDWGRKEDLDAKTAARLARLNKSKDKKSIVSKETIRLPINKVTVMFYKPLFEDFFKRASSTYSFPIGMYAKIFDVANTTKKALLKSQQNDPGILCFDSDVYISAYTNLMRFIMRHNNLTPAQMRDKKTAVPIKSISAIDFFNDVYRSVITRNGRGDEYIDYPMAAQFLINATFMLYKIPDFKLYPVIILSKGMKNLEITLFTDRNAALQVWEAITRL